MQQSKQETRLIILVLEMIHNIYVYVEVNSIYMTGILHNLFNSAAAVQILKIRELEIESVFMTDPPREFHGSRTSNLSLQISGCGSASISFMRTTSCVAVSLVSFNKDSC